MANNIPIFGPIYPSHAIAKTDFDRYVKGAIIGKDSSSRTISVSFLSRPERFNIRNIVFEGSDRDCSNLHKIIEKSRRQMMKDFLHAEEGHRNRIERAIMSVSQKGER